MGKKNGKNTTEKEFLNQEVLTGAYNTMAEAYDYLTNLPEALKGIAEALKHLEYLEASSLPPHNVGFKETQTNLLLALKLLSECCKEKLSLLEEGLNDMARELFPEEASFYQTENTTFQREAFTPGKPVLKLLKKGNSEEEGKHPN